jgi:glutathione S-transferase
MAVKLTGAPPSLCTLRVLMVLAEKGVKDVDIHVPDFAAGEIKVCEGSSLQPENSNG